MAEFPKEFSKNLEPIATGEEFDPNDHPWAFELAFHGLQLQLGLRRADVPELAKLTEQPGIQEFCPKDGSERWGSEEMAAAKLAAGNGRAFFQLRGYTMGASDIAGYGWVGSEKCKELPGCETTFAVRLNEKFQGLGLAVPFTQGILAAARQRFGAGTVGLETWASNTAAVRTYLAAGARLITTRDAERPTLDPEPQEKGTRMRRDVRLYMQFDAPEA